MFVVKEELKETLHNSKCKIVFTKVDGSTRIMVASLLAEHVDPIRPAEKPLVEGEEPKPPKPDNPNLIAVVDVEKAAWRSIKLDTIQSIEVLLNE